MGEEWEKLFLEKVLVGERKNIFQKLRPYALMQRSGAKRASLNIQGTAALRRCGETPEAGARRSQISRTLHAILNLIL